MKIHEQNKRLTHANLQWNLDYEIVIKPFMHTVVVVQRITVIELIKEQSKKRKGTKNKRIASHARKGWDDVKQSDCLRRIYIDLVCKVRMWYTNAFPVRGITQINIIVRHWPELYCKLTLYLFFI